MTWQRIPSEVDVTKPPFDGNDVHLGRAGERLQIIACWDDDPDEPPTPDYHWSTLDGPCYHRALFTHWMPLPAPPEDGR